MNVLSPRIKKKKSRRRLLIPVGLICLTLGNLYSLHTKGISALSTTNIVWDDISIPGGRAKDARLLQESDAEGNGIGKLLNKLESLGNDKNLLTSIANLFSPVSRKPPIPTNDSTNRDKSSSSTHGKNMVTSIANQVSSVRKIPPIPTTTTTTTTTASTNQNKSSNSGHRIPRRLIFTFRTNLIYHEFPKHLYDNVHRTIHFYTEGWGLADQSQLDVLFLTDPDCIELLEQVEPRMVAVFRAEQLGSYKADMCRLAALYVHGGYYLDVDIEPVKVLDPMPNVDFITSKMTNGMYFQAIMASSAGHPVMKSALESMIIDWYMVPSILRRFNKSVDNFDQPFYQTTHYNEKRMEHIDGLGLNHDPKDILMGPMTLRLAFDRNKNATTPWFLHEEDNSKVQHYPDLIRKATLDQSWGCNYMVHDPENMTAYFYSRCRGTWLCPFE